MEHRFIEAQGAALSGVKADALVVVLTAEQSRTGDKAIDAAIDDALKQGDLSLKAGRSLFCHRVLGTGKARLVLSVAGGASAKAFKAAVSKGLAQVKELGVAHAAVAAAQGVELSAAHARALVQAADEATYVYRQTKPSAPAAGALRKVSLLGAKAQQVVLSDALKQAMAQVAGVALAREFGKHLNEA